MFNNTLYAPGATTCGLDSSPARWNRTHRGPRPVTKIYVANDSTSGFFSDYNDLHASGTGKLVYWTKDFTDVLDWQEDVHQFDLHSIGHTVVNPEWSEPRFANRGQDDYRIFDQVRAPLRCTSPTVDAGDPRSDQGVPPTTTIC